MKLHTPLLAGYALLCLFSSARAAPPIVTNVQGVATSVHAGNARVLGAGAAVQDGTRLVTTSTSQLTLQAGGGCSVSVPPGHALTVKQGMNCQQLKSSVVPVIPDVAARSPSAPPPSVVDRLRAVGASPTAIGVVEQLTDEPISAH